MISFYITSIIHKGLNYVVSSLTDELQRLKGSDYYIQWALDLRTQFVPEGWS